MASARPRIALIVLAAGSSRRFGDLDKLATPIAGRALLAWTLDSAFAAQVAARDRVVVVGPGSGIAARLAESHGGRTVFAHDAERGMRASLRAGLAALDAEVTGGLVLLGDDPLAAAQVQAVLDQALGEPERIAAVRRADHVPHPVHLPRSAWTEAGDIDSDPDHGLRRLLAAGDVTWIDRGAERTLDVDVASDAAELAARLTS